MEDKHYKFFQNKECEYYPCHPGAGEEEFNCLFCYCPLYALGDKCGGDFVYLENGVKDCSGCIIPHSDGGYDHVISMWNKVSEMAKKR